MSRFDLFFYPCSHRMHLVLILMLGWSITSYMRMNLGMTMTCMVNTTAVMMAHNKDRETSYSNLHRFNLNVSNADVNVVNNYGGDLLWSPQMQNLLFSSSFWGSTLSNIPAGYISDHFSPRNTLMIAVIVMSSTTFAIPFLIDIFGFGGVFAARFVYGVADGFILPASNWIISRWVPRNELSQAESFFTSGFQLAGIVRSPVSAVFCES